MCGVCVCVWVRMCVRVNDRMCCMCVVCLLCACLLYMFFVRVSCIYVCACITEWDCLFFLFDTQNTRSCDIAKSQACNLCRMHHQLITFAMRCLTLNCYNTITISNLLGLCLFSSGVAVRCIRISRSELATLSENFEVTSSLLSELCTLACLTYNQKKYIQDITTMTRRKGKDGDGKEKDEEQEVNKRKIKALFDVMSRRNLHSYKMFMLTLHVFGHWRVAQIVSASQVQTRKSKPGRKSNYEDTDVASEICSISLLSNNKP